VRDTALRIAGFLLLVVPFLPLQLLFGDLHGGRPPAPWEWLLGLVVFVPPAWLITMAAAGHVERAFSWVVSRTGRIRAAPFAGVTLTLLGALLVLASTVAFSHQPLLVDAVVQLFQAKIFAAGSLSAPLPPLEDFFLTQHMLMDERGWYSQYPPLHSALLALGVWLGHAWIIPVALTVGTALSLFLFVRRIYGLATARLVLVLLVLSPFFWFMGASFMNHVSTLFFVSLFLLAFAAYEQDARPLSLFAAGAALGAAYLSRPLTAVAVGLPFAAVALAGSLRRRNGGALVAGALGFVLVASLYPIYNHFTTGHAFLPGYVKLWGPAHNLGFHETPWGDMHTPLTGLRNELTDLSLLNVFLFEWPLPALIPVGALFAAGWGRNAWDARLLCAFFAIPALYFFYWHRDAFLGPRFLYCGIAFVIPLTARAVQEGWRRLASVSLHPGGLLRPVRASTFAMVLLALCFAYAVAFGIPQRFGIYASGMRSAKVEVVRQAHEAGLKGGILFVAESWGSRILAQLRAAGLPASLAEKAYRRTDHCELNELALEFRGRRDSAALVRRVERLMALSGPVEDPGLNGDPTLRLNREGKIRQSCVQEILYDRQGYGVWTSHLPENQPGLDGPFVVARDLRERNAQLLALYPDRPAYLYRNGSFVPLR
jgi:hypothetical protein